MRGFWRLVAPLSFAITSAPVVFYRILLTRPDVVFCVEPTLLSAPVALFASRIVGARNVLHVQDLEVDVAFAIGHLSPVLWLKRLGNMLERLCLSRMHSVITISNRMADKLKEKGVDNKRISVVRNWVNLEHIYPLKSPSEYRTELGYRLDDFIVMYSGNIGAKQGLNFLLDAAISLVDNPRIHFIIAGEGPSKPQLIERYGQLPNVRFLPFQPYERLNDFLNLPNLHALVQDASAADLVLPSKLGGILASGVPALVTARSGTELADFVDGLACIVDPDDGDGLLRTITAMAVQNDRTELNISESLLELSHSACLRKLQNITFDKAIRSAI